MWYGSSMVDVARTDRLMHSLGVEAYRVGGSVRDEILGRAPKDADYMVRGVPLSELRNLLAARDMNVTALKLRDGQQAGWRASARGYGCIEVVLPRTEVSTGARHTDFKLVVDPHLTLDDDARRRDFTFNALYKSVVSLNVFDPTGRGIHDLRRRQINITHADSFRDDPLRILRALRFVATLGYDLGAETRACMVLHADAVNGLTERGYTSGTVYEELAKLLMGDHVVKALTLARDTGVLAAAFPELADMIGFEQKSRYHDMTTDEHTFAALATAAHTNAPLRVRLALLFHDAGKPEAAWVGKDGRYHYYASPREELDPNGLLDDDAWAFVRTEDHEIVGARLWRECALRLNIPRRVRDEVETLIREHMVPTQKANPVKVRRNRVRLGDDLLRDLYHMRMCDLSGKGAPSLPAMEKIATMEAVRAEAQAANVPKSVGDLAVGGRDALDLGASGRGIGDALRALLDEVVCDPSEAKRGREWQLERLGKLVPR